MKKNISFKNLQGLKNRPGGLSSEESESQKRHYGLNEIVEVAGRSWRELFNETIKDPMIWFLIGISAVFLLVGERGEAAILSLAVIPLLFMDAYLHRRTQASTSGLRKQLSVKARVFRDGNEEVIDSLQIVPGDLVAVSAQDFLPADGVFEKSENVQVDESVLTGEALPVKKRTSNLNHFDLADREETAVEVETMGYAGTRMLTGDGWLRVLLTARQTTYGQVVQSVIRVPQERTALQLAIAKLVKMLVLVAAGFCLVLAGVRLYQGYGWLDALLSAATLAVAAIPEEFPVVFTFFLGVGVFRLARQKALVRRAVSVENIGRVTRICSDKTGTITLGQLKLTGIDTAPQVSDHEVLFSALAASDPSGPDPVDQAIAEASQRFHQTAPVRLSVIPFTEDRRRESAIANDKHGRPFLHVKGSPETVLSMSDITKFDRRNWLRKTETSARQGKKILACARKSVEQTKLSFESEPDSGFQFLGLLAFADPPRPEAAAAMEACKRSGVKVTMITGDHLATALAIARETGLGGEAVTAVSAEENPQKFAPDWLSGHPEFLRSLDVVARCNPLQKLHIVEAFKKHGDLVAVTGDGVNDSPALQAADIGIAMGLRGTRSAREVSSIILADDNFSTIVNAIVEGRQLFTNLKNSFEYLLLFHIPFVLTAALIPLMGYPLLYLPIHIVWLELIIHPTALFAFQQAADENRPTGPLKNKFFFSRADDWRIAIVGGGLTAMLAFSYVAGLAENHMVEHARAKTLALLSLWSAGLIFGLTKARSRAAKYLLVLTLCSSAILIQTPVLSRWLHLSPLHWHDWLETLVTLSVFLALLFILKWISPANDDNLAAWKNRL